METLYNLTFEDIEALGLMGVAEGTPAMRGELDMLVELGRVPSDVASMLKRTSGPLTPAETVASTVQPPVDTTPTVTAPPPTSTPTVSSAEPAANQSAGAPLVNTGLVDTLGGTPRQVVDPEAKQLEQMRKRMLAAAAIRDAGFALMGKEGTAVSSLLGAFNEQDDMSRKAQAAQARQAALNQFMGGGAGGAFNITDTSPEGLEAAKREIIGAMVNGLIKGPEGQAMLDYITSLQAAGGAKGTNLQGIRAIDELLQSDDLEKITGVAGVANSYLEKIGLAPKYSNLMSFVRQLEGITFMEAYQGLKGGGAISNFEADKASAAEARFKAALLAGPDELRAALEETKALFEEAIRKNPTYSGELEDDGGLSEDDLKYIFGD